MTSPKIIGAAHAVASWARARRATWTDAPLLPPAGAAPPAHAEPPLQSASASIQADHGEDVGPPDSLPLVVEPSDAAPSDIQAARGLSRGRESRVAIAAVALLALSFGGTFVWKYTAGSANERSSAPIAVPSSAPAPSPAPSASTAAPGAEPPAPPVTAPPTAVGRLTIASTPAGASVKVDNTPRGETPLSLSDIPAGRHVILLESPAGSVERTVTVSAGAETAVNEAIFSGWVAVFAPFEVSVAEGGRELRLDERGQIMLSPGPHDLTITNRGRAFAASRRVVIRPGEITRLSIVP